MLLLLLVVVVQVAQVSARNGYALSFQTTSQVAGTRSQAFDSSIPVIGQLSTGFSVMLWCRFRDLSPSLFQPNVQIILMPNGGNFIQPFGGVHGGFELGGIPPPTVATLGESASGWHHYAMTWNAADGDRRHYVDGVLIHSDTAVRSASSGVHAAGINWDYAYLILGMSCYPNQYMEKVLTSCNPQFRVDGEMDDVAVFSGALSAADVLTRRDESITDRLLAGLEPNLAFFVRGRASNPRRSCPRRFCPCVRSTPPMLPKC